MDSILDSDLSNENEELKRKIKEAAETINAIKHNMVDAFVVTTEKGNQIYTLQDNEKNTDIIFDLTSEAVIVCDTNGKILRYNRPAMLLATENLLGSSDFDDIYSLSDKENEKIHLKDLIEKKHIKELYFTRKDGKICFLDYSVEPFTDKQGNTQGFVLTLLDITRHVLAERKAIESIKEKTLLIKEIHHRVKNNLQIILSIINLQSFYLKDAAAKEAFMELQGRIRSIALIHEKLYQAETVTELRIDHYIQELVEYLKKSYDLIDGRINFVVETEPLFLDHAKAVNLGLIITELITNAIKYAFLGRDGEIHVSIKKVEENKVLIIQDNGKGLPENINIAETETLGLQLLTSLTEQINGKVELQKCNGTCYRITFP